MKADDFARISVQRVPGDASHRRIHIDLQLLVPAAKPTTLEHLHEALDDAIRDALFTLNSPIIASQNRKARPLPDEVADDEPRGDGVAARYRYHGNHVYGTGSSPIAVCNGDRPYETGADVAKRIASALNGAA